MRRLSKRLSLERDVLDAIKDESQRELSSWESEDMIQQRLCKCRECEPLIKEARRLLEDERLVSEMEVENKSYYLEMFRAKLKQLWEKICE